MKAWLFVARKSRERNIYVQNQGFITHREDGGQFPSAHDASTAESGGGAHPKNLLQL